jgi:hypothetical protein
METSDVRRRIFGRADRTEAFLVQVWTVPPTGKSTDMILWRSETAFTKAGVNRIKRSRRLLQDVRGEAVILVLKVSEVDTEKKPKK